MINSIEELEQWFKFAVDYARKTPGNNRRAFDTAAVAANRLFTPEFTDAVLILFDEVVDSPPPRPVRSVSTAVPATRG